MILGVIGSEWSDPFSFAAWAVRLRSFDYIVTATGDEYVCSCDWA